MKGLSFFTFTVLAGLAVFSASSVWAEEQINEVKIVGIEAGHKDNFI